MPIYEYECQTCHHRVELIQKVSDAPLAECPKCKGVVKRLIAPPALQFKGSGWYITDYSAKGKSKTDDAPADKKAEESKPSSAPAATSTPEKKSDGGGGSSPPSSKSEGNASS
ncbi:MAG: FmdB family zinc ribbon protein [Nitrospirota bacterium]